MALSALRYRPDHSTAAPVETKSGSYIYDGSVNNFHEWEFRTEMRITAATTSGDPDKDLQFVANAVSKIVEGLRGDAFDMAMDIGKAKLLTKDGVDELIKMIRSSLFPIEAQEAKVLFQAGQRPHGPMSRQNGESMVSYISRRKRWWNMVKKLDTTMVFSDEMLGSLLLDHAGLTHHESLMVLTATGNVTQDQGCPHTAAWTHPLEDQRRRGRKRRTIILPVSASQLQLQEQGQRQVQVRLLRRIGTRIRRLVVPRWLLRGPQPLPGLLQRHVR